MGDADTISFQIGWPHWWLVILFLILLLLLLCRKNLVRVGIAIPENLGALKTVILACFLLMIFITGVFMTHNRSTFIWEKISILAYVQFPWRFLSIIIFSSSLLGGMLTIFWKEKVQIIWIGLIIILTVFFNWIYFNPESFFPLTDKEKLSGKLWEEQQKAAILDYLPTTAVEPKEPAPSIPIVRSGKVKLSNFVNKSNKWSFDAKVMEDTDLEVPVFDFPGWEVQVDNQKIPHNHNNYVGRISFSLSPGQYSVVGKFKNTPIRLYSNIISIISLVITIGIVIYGNNKKHFLLKKRTI